MPKSFLLTMLCVAVVPGVLNSCCEPGQKDSQPYVVNSKFQETYGRDIDLYRQFQSGSSVTDSAYYPVYTFGIQNTGTQDDDYTLQLRYGPLQDGTYLSGFDITKHVPAGQTMLFRSPVLVPDSITANARYAYESYLCRVTGDTAPNLDEIYYGLSFQTTDSAEIHNLRPTLDIVYGAINNGPEGCNTPASSMPVNIDSLPVR